MPGIIDSAPDCIQKVSGAKPPDDSADFIIQQAYLACGKANGGIMTFGPGSTYGDGGAKAANAYYVLTYVGIAFTLVVIVGWVIYEHRRLLTHAARIGMPGRRGGGQGQVQPGVTPEEV